MIFIRGPSRPFMTEGDVGIEGKLSPRVLLILASLFICMSVLFSATCMGIQVAFQPRPPTAGTGQVA